MADTRLGRAAQNVNPFNYLGPAGEALAKAAGINPLTAPVGIGAYLGSSPDAPEATPTSNPAITTTPTPRPSAAPAKPSKPSPAPTPRKAPAATQQAPSGVQGYMQQLSKMLPDRYKGAQGDLDAIKNSIQSERDNAAAYALMQAGLGIMASKSPFMLQAIGEGGTLGMAAYKKHKSQLNDQDLKRAASNLQLAGLLSKQDLAKLNAALKLHTLDKKAALAGSRRSGKYGLKPKDILNAMKAAADPKYGGLLVNQITQKLVDASKKAGRPMDPAAARVKAQEYVAKKFLGQ